MEYTGGLLEIAVQDNRKHNGKQWDVLWVHAHLATMSADSGYGIIKDAALAITDGRIAWVGKAVDLPGTPQSLAREVQDAGGAWITPGLIDCHTHLVYAGNRAGEFAQ